MEQLSEAIATYTSELEKVQTTAPEHGCLRVNVLGMESTPQDSVGLRLSTQAEGEGASEKLVGDEVDLPKSEGAVEAELRLLVMVTDAEGVGEVALEEAGDLQAGAEVEVTIGDGPARVSLKVQSLGSKKERVEKISKTLAALRAEKNSMRARAAQARRLAETQGARDRSQAEAEDAAAKASGSPALEMALGLAALGWHARGWALFAVTVGLLHYRGDYLAM